MDGLGQGELVSNAAQTNFASYVTKAAAGTIETTEGSFVLRSVKAGEDGVISVIGISRL